MNTIKTVEDLAVALWQEQLARGLGFPGEKAEVANVDLWIDNHDVAKLALAAQGDVYALSALRTDCGLPVFV